MKLLLFSDLHCNSDAAESILERAPAFDIAIGAGDFANAHHGIDTCIDILRHMTIPTVVCPGNNESYEELHEACRGWEGVHVLHGTSTTIFGVPIFGIGGGIPMTPFGSWSYDFTEEQSRAMFAKCPERAIIVSHSPPKGILDRSSSGQHLGSTTLFEMIAVKKPPLIVCGHIHACGGLVERFGDCTIVNAGPLGVELNLQIESDID
jgi:uncharacterized protein